METINLINMDTHCWGYIAVISGLAMLLKIGTNRYQRRGVGGLQGFHCHFIIALLITAIEWLVLRMGWILILLGVFMAIRYPSI